MKITVNVALQAVQGLHSLNNSAMAVGGLPMQLSMDLAFNARAVSDIQDAFNDNRNAVLKKFGEKDAETGKVKIPQEKQEEFDKAMRALGTQEVEIEPRQIKASRFPSYDDGFKIEPLALIALEWMLLEE